MSDATAVTTEALRAWPLPRHDGDADKDERGRVLVIGGCREVPGAVLLASTAALRAGAGKLQIATVASVAVMLGIAMPEALVIGLDESPNGAIARGAAAALAHRIVRCDTVLVGPGMMGGDEVADLTATLLDTAPGPVFVIDAAPIATLAGLDDLRARHRGRIVITPHAGEMAALLDVEREAVAADPERIAREVARDLGIVVALKGGVTHIATPDGDSWYYAGGDIGLATSGSGDTLAGVVAGLCARGATAAQAAVWGVYLHGEAGNRLARRQGRIGFLARELLAEVPPIMAELAG